MTEGFELTDAARAQAYLSALPLAARRKGQVCFGAGAVSDLRVETPGQAYSATVRDEGEHHVYLEYDPDEGWLCDCSCDQQFNCAHIFSALSALLAEHRTARVRRLSAQAAAPAAGPVKSGGKTADLIHLLRTSLGREFDESERTFLARLRQVYARCCQTRRLSAWDIQQLGLAAPNLWAYSRIWPSFPETEQEFWLYLANAVQEAGGAIPDFMAPVTDLRIIQPRLARWRRSLEIQRWKQTLSNLQQVGPRLPATAEQTDLRLRIEDREAKLEWLPPGRAEFGRLSSTQLRQLADQFDLGTLRMPAEAQLLWQIYSRALDHAYGFRWGYLDSESGKLLSRLLRSPILESRIVDATGVPLRRPADPLRWSLTVPESPDEDYAVRMVQADGQPAPSVLCVVSGLPSLYLTAEAVFAGPEPHEHVLSVEEETRIPAAALETAEGVALLHRLGAELPPALARRVRMLPYEIAINCELREHNSRRDAEECVVAVTAEAPNGHRQVWTGYNWLVEQPAGGRTRRTKPEKGSIQVYDPSRLTELQALLEPLNLRPTGYGSDLSVKVTKKFPERFAAWLASLPSHVTIQLSGELESFRTADLAGHVKLEVSEAEIDWFDLRVVLEVADTTLSPEEIKLLLNAKGDYVRLEGKGWRRLRYDFTDEENEKLARLGLSPGEFSAAPQRLHALQLADDSARRFLPQQQVERIQRRVGEIKARVAPPLPGGVAAELRPYQLEGFHFLAYLGTNRFGGILADDMGLGKTLQALAWLSWLRQQSQDSRPVLVVCPKSVMDNWHAEAARFTPGLRLRAWSAGELPDFATGLAQAHIHVINYSQLRTLAEAVASVRWLAVILDEGQYIKNADSQTARVARSLRAEHRLVLTGTPIENRLADLWSLMAFAMPGVLGSRAQFGRLYDAKGDPFARRRLAARVRPFVLRRTKGQVAQDLPDRIEEDLFCELEGQQEALYRAELKRAQQLLLGIKTQQELAKQQFNFLTSLLRLRQICCDSRLLNKEASGPNAKTEALLEQLEPLMEEGQKVLVFSQFVEMLKLLKPALEQRDWPVFYLAGDTEDRGPLIRRFQEAEGPAIFLISLKAGGFGLNLTAASYVVLFDPWWNPAVENQAIDRTHRIGQDRTVMAYRLLIKNSVEEKIRALQKQKKALAEDVLGEEKFSQGLTLDDLRFLFSE